MAEQKDYNVNGVCTVSCLEEEIACTNYLKSEVAGVCLWRRWRGSVCAAPPVVDNPAQPVTEATRL